MPTVILRSMVIPKVSALRPTCKTMRNPRLSAAAGAAERLQVGQGSYACHTKFTVRPAGKSILTGLK